MSMTTETKSAFITRFDRIWTQARRVQLSQALCWALVTALAGIALLAAVDYCLELSHTMRIGAMIGIGLASFAVAVRLAVQSLHRWRRKTTAVAIEQVFPQLGQRIRTTVQYSPLSSGQLDHEGIAMTMVAALENDTIQRAQPLPLDAVIPWKALAITSLLAAAMGLGLAGAAAVDSQWRSAAQRAFLGDEPYTRIIVEPGNVTVRENEAATIHIAVEGRTGREVTFATRPLGDEAAEWDVQPLIAEEAEQSHEQPASIPQVKYEVPFAKIREPLEYRVSAGTVTSDTYRIEVLYPLKIVKIQTALQAPEYTGLPELVTPNGNVSGLVGSKAKLQIELDRESQTAWLEIQEMNRPAKDPPPPVKVPLTIDGVNLSAELTLTTDQTYVVMAKDAHDMVLPENKYRIRVRQDEPPQIWFESPAEAVEVHALAEILMQIRVSDDFGLSKAAIMFEVNNEEVLPLLSEDFLPAAKELQATGKLSPKTRAHLEKILPLELFGLSEKDSVMYYAFVEDNRPNSPQRVESDLRFIDIRPFRRNYRSVDAGAAMMPRTGPQIKFLEELISRQRYALNRTIQIERRFKQSATPDLAGVDALIKFEAEVAKFTRELAEFLETQGVEETELLYEAETAMLGATDSLSAGKYDTASLQQRDALKYLIEGRNRLEVRIQRNRNPAQMAGLRQFDRIQRQKLRRPKSDTEKAEEIVKRLEQLAQQEGLVAMALGMPTDNPNGLTGDPMKGAENKDSQTEPGQTGTGDDKSEDPSGEKPADPKASTKPMPAKTGTEQNPEGDPQDPKAKPEAGSKADPMDKANADGKKMPGGKAGDKPQADKSKEGAGSDPKADEDDQKPGGQGGSNRPNPRELEDKQLDVALETREIEKDLERLTGVTDLAKERIAAAAKNAEEAAQALARSNTPAAKEAAEKAKQGLEEVSEQVKALIAKELAERIAAAQQMAANLAREQQKFVDKLANGEGSGGEANEQSMPKEKQPPMPGIGKGEQPPKTEEEKKMPSLGTQAADIARQAETLKDVLTAAAKSTEPENQAAAKKIEGLIGAMKLEELTQRLEKLPQQVGAGEMKDAKSAAEDGAERMEAVAEQLASLQQSIVEPQVDQLTKLEAKLGSLDQELDELETEKEVAKWHGAADDLLAELEEGGISKERRQQFVEEMTKTGWGPDSARNRSRVVLMGGRFVPPKEYHQVIRLLQNDVRNRIQELLLGDLRFSRDEAIPPQYQDLVDRYQQVLATERTDPGKRMKEMPAKAKK